MNRIQRSLFTRVFRYSTAVLPKLYIFAGQGTQQLGMLQGLNPEFKKDVVGKVKELINVDMEQITTTDANNMINETQVTQPLVLMSHYLHFEGQIKKRKLESTDIMIGHSLGQYSALVNSRSLSFEDGIKLVHQRGKLMKKYTKTPHGMLITKFRQQKYDYLIEEINKLNLQIACVNTRTSVIIAGQIDKITQLSKKLKLNKIFSVQLPVSTAFHCRMLQDMKDQYYQCLRNTNFQAPYCKVLRNYDCKPYESAYDIRQGLLLQVTNPVLFYNSVKLVDKSIAYEQIGHKHWISRFVIQIHNE